MARVSNHFTERCPQVLERKANFVEGIMPGDCGSWVVDDATLEVYGHVVASDLFQDAHVVPLSAVFADIKKRMSAFEVELPISQEAQSWSSSLDRSEDAQIAESEVDLNSSNVSEIKEVSNQLLSDPISTIDNDRRSKHSPRARGTGQSRIASACYACYNCKKDHLSCDSTRPCNRCKNTNVSRQPPKLIICLVFC